MSNQDLMRRVQSLYRESVEKSSSPAWRVKKTEHFLYDPQKRVLDLKKSLKDIFDKINKNYFPKVLDMGAGRGELCFALADFADEVVGLEPDYFSNEISKLLKEYFNAGNVNFVKGVGEKLPFENENFDLVVSTSTLEHMPGWKDSLDEINRILKNDGFFYLNVPNYFWFREPHYELPMFPLMPKFFLKILSYFTQRNPEYINHIQYLTPWKLERELKKRGFEIRNLAEESLKKSLLGGGGNRKIILWLKRFKLSRLTFLFFSKCKMYPHIIILARKI